VQFGVTEALLAGHQRHDEGTPPAPDVMPPWYTLHRRFVLRPGELVLPPPPITGKANGPRPPRVVL
jgi:hypothetical protein